MKPPQTRAAFTRFLKTAFDELDSLANDVDAKRIADQAARYACRFGAPVHPEPTTTREAMIVVGNLLAWARRPEPSELLKVEEVAAMLGVSARTVWRGVSAGEFPAPVKVLGATRWKRDDLRNFLSSL